MPAAQPAFSDRDILTSETKPLCFHCGWPVSAGLSPAWIGVCCAQLNLAGVEAEGEILFVPGFTAPCFVGFECGSVPQEVPFDWTQY